MVVSFYFAPVNITVFEHTMTKTLTITWIGFLIFIPHLMTHSVPGLQ